MTIPLLVGKGKEQIPRKNRNPRKKQSPRKNRNYIPNIEKRLMGKSMKLEFQREPFLINDETPFHVTKMYKLHRNTPRPYFSRDGQHLEMGTSV